MQTQRYVVSVTNLDGKLVYSCDYGLASYPDRQTKAEIKSAPLDVAAAKLCLAADKIRNG